MTHFHSFLFPRLQTEIPGLKLRPLRISAMIEPIVNGDGGINCKTYYQFPDGLFCAVDAYAEPMRKGDTLDIYWGKDHKIFTRVLQDDEDGSNQPVFFFLPVTNILPGWVDEVYYVLTRAGSTSPEEPATPLRILVKLDLPGGKDDEPHLPGHAKLHIVQLPRDVIVNGVDAVWAAKGVPMVIPPYPNIAVRDVIQVQWGNAFLSPHTVSADEAAGTAPIEITAHQDDIVAGGDGNAQVVHYGIHDEVFNHSEKWSLRTTVKVMSGIRQLDEPIIQESVNGIIDLDKLNNRDVNVHVRASTSDFEVGDTVTMTWVGTPPTGAPLPSRQSQRVESFPSILMFQIPNAQVRATARGTADVSYVRYKKDDGSALPSRHELATVEGRIPAPVLSEAAGNTVSADITSATVNIQYPGMTMDDIVDMAWLGTKANGIPYLYEARHIVSPQDVENHLVTLYVPGKHLRVLENGALNLFYRVSRDGPHWRGAHESGHQEINVLRFT